MNDKTHTLTPSRCVRQVLVPGVWSRYHQCSRKATAGSAYCKQHDPATVEAKRKEKHARWDREAEERIKRHDLQAAAPALLEACRALLAWKRDIPENLEKQAKDAIAKAEGR